MCRACIPALSRQACRGHRPPSPTLPTPLAPRRRRWAALGGPQPCAPSRMAIAHHCPRARWPWPHAAPHRLPGASPIIAHGRLARGYVSECSLAEGEGVGPAGRANENAGLTSILKFFFLLKQNAALIIALWTKQHSKRTYVTTPTRACLPRLSLVANAQPAACLAV